MAAQGPLWKTRSGFLLTHDSEHQDRTGSGPHCCRMPEGFPTASDCQEAKHFPQTSLHRDIWVAKIYCTGRKRAVRWRQLLTRPKSHSSQANTSTNTGWREFPQGFTCQTGRGLHTVEWVHSWVGGAPGLSNTISTTPEMQVIYCPGGEVSLLSSGEEIQTNVRTGISCLAFWGGHISDLFPSWVRRVF